MARTKTNKSAAIKEALKENPSKGPKEIAEMVTKAGTKVTAMYVSNIKASMGKSKKKERGAASRDANLGTVRLPMCRTPSCS